MLWVQLLVFACVRLLWSYSVRFCNWLDAVGSTSCLCLCMCLLWSYSVRFGNWLCTHSRTLSFGIVHMFFSKTSILWLCMCLLLLWVRRTKYDVACYNSARCWNWLCIHHKLRHYVQKGNIELSTTLLKDADYKLLALNTTPYLVQHCWKLWCKIQALSTLMLCCSNVSMKWH
jgi:hypothetical protein